MLKKKKHVDQDMALVRTLQPRISACQQSLGSALGCALRDALGSNQVTAFVACVDSCVAINMEHVAVEAFADVAVDGLLKARLE